MFLGILVVSLFLVVLLDNICSSVEFSWSLHGIIFAFLFLFQFDEPEIFGSTMQPSFLCIQTKIVCTLCVCDVWPGGSSLRSKRLNKAAKYTV